MILKVGPTAARIAPPAIIVIGDVVDLRETLSWFETKPLFGWDVLVPRTKEQSASMTARLEHHGAHAEVVPTISVEPPRTPQQLERAARENPLLHALVSLDPELAPLVR